MAKSESESKLWAFLAYLLGIIGFVLVIALKKNDKFSMYHAKQSLVLFIFGVIIWIVGSVIPVIGWFIIMPLGNILLLILWIQGIVNSLTGAQKPVWLVGKYGEKLHF